MKCHLSVTGAVTNHLQKYHKPEWDAYSETRTRANAKKAEAKEEEKLACEMENNEVRFYDVRSSKGRLPFLKKVGLCDIFLISMMFPVQILPDVNSTCHLTLLNLFVPGLQPHLLRKKKKAGLQWPKEEKLRDKKR